VKRFPDAGGDTLGSKNAVSFVSSRTSSLLTLRTSSGRALQAAKALAARSSEASAVEWKNFVPLPRHWVAALPHL
jgi:hypothetical protein